jgi:hypothetical protein
MTVRDKLEIGLKEDAPYRKDNLPEAQVRGLEIPLRVMGHVRLLEIQNRAIAACLKRHETASSSSTPNRERSKTRIRS